MTTRREYQISRMLRTKKAGSGPEAAPLLKTFALSAGESIPLP